MRFSSDLVLPRPDGGIGIPKGWLDDRAINYDARGALVYMAMGLEPGVELTDADLDERRHPSDPPMAVLVDELAAAGYLRLVSDLAEPYYKLVHPDRVGPLPVVEE